MKRLISMLLLAAFLAVPFASCAKPAEGESETSGGIAANPAGEETETEPAETVDPRLNVSDDLPDERYEGQSFRIASEERSRFELTAEELTGDIANDAVYNRNLAVSERFGVTLEAVTVPDATNAAVKTVSAGTRDYEIVSLINYQSGGAIVKNAFHNWYEVPLVDLGKPWWSSLIVQNSTINGKAFTVTGDLAVTALTYTFGMFFNQKVCADWGYPVESLHTMVYEDEWTVDRFTALVDAIYTDNNGNGEKDIEDTFGLGGDQWDAIDVWISALGQPVSGRDENGFMTIDLVSEKTVSVVEKMIALLHDSPGASLLYARGESMFLAQDLLAFAPIMFNDCFGVLRDMESPYGILPMPKYDETQQKYLTTLMDEFTTFGALRSVPESELGFVGTVFTALNAESYRKVYPAYYDVALKNKYSEDPETAKMIDLIMEGRTFDPAFTFGTSYLNRFPYCIRDLVLQGSTDIASKYAASKSAVTKGLQKINGAYA